VSINHNHNPNPDLYLKWVANLSPTFEVDVSRKGNRRHRIGSVIPEESSCLPLWVRVRVRVRVMFRVRVRGRLVIEISTSPVTSYSNCSNTTLIESFFIPNPIPNPVLNPNPNLLV
jgi:hypothetical protein